VKVRAHRGYVRLREALGDDIELPPLAAEPATEAGKPAGNRGQAGSI
jgi:hypothetical protein